MFSNRIIVLALCCVFLVGPAPAFAQVQQRQEKWSAIGWVERSFHWAISNALNLMAGSAFGAITTAIVAIKLKANGLPIENARLIAQVVHAAQGGRAISFEPLSHFANAIRAAHESGIPLNEDGTFAVDWWRLDETTKKLFVAALKRLSGQP